VSPSRSHSLNALTIRSDEVSFENLEEFFMIDIRGATVALLTPVDSAGEIDHRALERLVAATLAGGVSKISPLGSTGEGYSFDLQARLSVIDTVVAVAGSAPVVPGLFAHGPAAAVTQIAHYAEHGAQAVLVCPPSYYPLTDDEVERFFTAIADVSALPVVMYSIPVYSKVVISAGVVGRLAAHPRIVGIKDSSRDFGQLQAMTDVLRAKHVDVSDFSVLTGTDSMLVAAMQAGAGGTIAASANIAPQLSAGIVAAMGEGRLVDALILEERVRAVTALCRAGVPPVGIKAAVAATGLCGPGLAPPRVGSPELVEPMRHGLAELDLLPVHQ
jgi:4-hydroxy-tetrahydrodipicolinate synthase